MNPFTLKIKLIAGAVVIALLFGSGVWIRGVFAEAQALKIKNDAQAAELKDITDEMDRMDKLSAADHVLFTQAEVVKAQIVKDLSQSQRELKT